MKAFALSLLLLWVIFIVAAVFVIAEAGAGG